MQTRKLSSPARNVRADRLRRQLEQVQDLCERGLATQADVDAVRQRLAAAIRGTGTMGDLTDRLYAPPPTRL